MFLQKKFFSLTDRLKHKSLNVIYAMFPFTTKDFDKKYRPTWTFLFSHKFNHLVKTEDRFRVFAQISLIIVHENYVRNLFLQQQLLITFPSFSKYHFPHQCLFIYIKKQFDLLIGVFHI